MPSRACTSSGPCGNHAVAEPKTECKEFVVIGNGPSGIAVSYLLAGHWPYYTGQSRDEFLHTRLGLNPGLSLVEQNLEFLSDGLEGRSNNPVSLLLDALQNPDADIGLEEPSLLEWRKVEEGRVDHVVLGRGRPGGIWQSLDGGLLTVSLGGWMELPNLTMEAWRQTTAGEQGPEPPTQRIDGASLARYYPDYVAAMGLQENFVDNTVVTLVRQVQGEEAVGREEVKPAKMAVIQEQEPVVAEILVAEEVFSFDVEESVSDSLSSRCSSMTGLHRRSLSSISVDSSAPPPSSLPSPYDRLRVPGPEHSSYCRSLNCDFDDCDLLCNWNPIMNPSLFGSLGPKASLPNPSSLAAYSASLGESYSRSRRRSLQEAPDLSPPCSCTFEVTGYRLLEGGLQQPFKYLTKNVVLATGQADTPNRLAVPGEELPFVLHSLPELEMAVEAGVLDQHSHPVLIVGAGLSAADAVINTQAHGVPVAHVFRKSVNDPNMIFNKLPVKLYPEYHAVHNMMAGRRPVEERPVYRAWAESEVVRIHEDGRVDIQGQAGPATIQVSYVVVLIGACPNLSFLSCEVGDLGRVPGQAIDRNNQIDMDVFSHQSARVPGLFAMGPLTGDNFVRFLQGGALAIANHVHHQRGRAGADEMAA